MRTVVLIAVFNLVFYAFLGAQNESYIHYSSRNGLPGNVLYSVCQDDEGYIWIGGASGLSRFDGTYFRNFSIKDGIPDIEILKLEKDRQGRIWMLGFNGKIGYIHKGHIFDAKKVPLLKKATLKGAPCFFYQIPQNDIEITDEKGFVITLCFDKNELKSVKKRKQTAIFSIKPSSKRVSLFWDFWTVGKKSLPFHYIANSPVAVYNQSIIVRGEDEITALTAGGPKTILKLQREHVTEQFEIDKEQTLWYYDASDRTINSCNLRQKKPAAVTRYHFPYSFNQFYIDPQGNLWVCSENKGLFFYPKKWQSSKQILLPEFTVTALYYTSDGQLILGNTLSEIIFFNPDNLQLEQRIQTNSMLYYAPVRGFKESCSKVICAYGYFQDYKLTVPSGTPKQLKLANGKDVSFDCNGKMFLAKSSGLQYGLEKDVGRFTYLTDFRSYAVCCVSAREYWYSDIFGLHVVNAKGSQRIPSRTEVFSNRISRIERLPDGNLFLLTDGIGCSVFNTKKRRPAGKIFTLPGVNDYRGIHIQKDTIWLATNNGIIALKYADQAFRLIRKIQNSDGLLSNDVLAVTSSENYIYASTPEGVSKLNKSTLLSKLDPPKLRINNISVDGISYQGNTVKTRSVPNEIIVELSALHFGSTAPLEFAYSLNNGKSWNTTNTPQIHLQNLEGGDLEVLFKARRTGGEWSTTRKRMIVIPIPFFQLFWVQFLLISAVVGIAIWLTVLFTGNIRKKQLLAKDTQLTMADLELKSLRSMMNTHFVFNALNSIQQFIAGKNHLEANRYLGKFSHLMRSHLNASLDSLISLTEELHSLDHYLALEKLRLEERLEYTFTVPESLPNIQIPGFILQPLVENAIWHGLMPLEEGGKVEIIVELTDNELTIFIRDNGVGLSSTTAQSHSSRGLQMIRKRFEILTDRTGRLHSLQLKNTVESDPSALRGVTAVITITRN